VYKILVVGYGEVGKPLFEIVRGVYPDAEWLDVESKEVNITPDIMHICFPEQTRTDFVMSCVKYVERFSPELVLIESTVTPGTTLEIHRKLTENVLLCHSPVRGNMVEGMKRGLLQYTKFIGPTSSDAGVKAKEYYETLGMKTHVCSSPIETELGKIFETTYRGLMMSWFQETHRICRHLQAQYDQVVEFVGSTEREGKQARPVFHPGVIGGHCIIPNAEKLLSVYRSKFAEALLESNRKRQEELSQGGASTHEIKEHVRGNQGTD
jgi:UDP-N-acetyl-D-mannosaminuronate dehydrogenase